MYFLVLFTMKFKNTGKVSADNCYIALFELSFKISGFIVMYI